MHEVGRSGIGESFLFFVESERKCDAPAEPRVTHEVDLGGRGGMVMEEEAKLTWLKELGIWLLKSLLKNL